MADEAREKLVFFGRTHQSTEQLVDIHSDELVRPLDKDSQFPTDGSPPARHVWLRTLSNEEHGRPNVLTLRALVMGCAIGTVTTAENVYFALKYGWTTTNNLSAAILGHAALATMDRCGLGGSALRPTSEGENCILMTTAVASTCMTWAGSLPFCVFAMSKTIQKYVNEPDDSPDDTWDPCFSALLAYCACMGFTGYFLAIPLRQLFVVDDPLPFPYALSGAQCIRTLNARGRVTHDGSGGCAPVALREEVVLHGHGNRAGNTPDVGLDGPHDDEEGMAPELVAMLQGLFPGLIWSVLMWVLHGMEYWPLFGVRAKTKYNWKLDITGANVGRAFLIPERFIYSQMVGAIVANGVILPTVVAKAGEWYPVGSTGFQGPDAYLYMPAIFCIVADSVYQLCRIGWRLWDAQASKRRAATGNDALLTPDQRSDTMERDQQAKEGCAAAPMRDWHALDRGASGQLVPTWIWVAGLAVSSSVGIVAWPLLFPGTSTLKAVLAVLVAPLWSVGITHAIGVTGSNMASYVAKFMIIVFAAWYGGQDSSSHHVVNSLALGSLSTALINQAADLVRDLKTSHMLGVSVVKTMAAQLLGAFVSLFTTTSLYLFLINRLAVPSEDLPAYLTILYRELAFVFEAGFSALPQHCLAISAGFGAFALVTAVLDDFVQWQYPAWGKCAPSAIAFGIGIVLGPGQSIMAVLGLGYKEYWRATSRPGTIEQVGALFGAGLLAGDGIGGSIQCFLEAAGVAHPMTVTFADGDH